MNEEDSENEISYVSTIVGIVLVLAVIATGIIIDVKEINIFGINDPGSNPGTGLCSKIQGTPAWADSNGKILGYGFNEFEVDKLIDDGITYLYHPQCSFCIKQKEYFGEDWEKYVASGLTINCQEELNKQGEGE